MVPYHLARRRGLHIVAYHPARRVRGGGGGGGGGGGWGGGFPHFKIRSALINNERDTYDFHQSGLRTVAKHIWHYHLNYQMTGCEFENSVNTLMPLLSSK